MDVETAARLIATGVPRSSAAWADFGAGSGTFTLALASLLAPQSRVIAVDRDADALQTLRDRAADDSLGSIIETRVADFREPLACHELDGVLLANALHFIPAQEQPAVLRRAARLLRPGGRLLIVEYDGRAANEWVPFPVPLARLTHIGAAIGWAAPTLTGRRPSRYGGDIYAAYVVIP